MCLEVGVDKWKSAVDRSESDNPRWGYIPAEGRTPAKHLGESHLFERSCRCAH